MGSRGASSGRSSGNGVSAKQALEKQTIKELDKKSISEVEQLKDKYDKETIEKYSNPSYETRQKETPQETQQRYKIIEQRALVSQYLREYIKKRKSNNTEKENKRFTEYSKHTTLSKGSNIKTGDKISQRTINEQGEKLKPKKWTMDSGVKAEQRAEVTVTGIKKTAKQVTVNGYIDNGKGGRRNVKTTYKNDELVGIVKK